MILDSPPSVSLALPPSRVQWCWGSSRRRKMQGAAVALSPAISSAVHGRSSRRRCGRPRVSLAAVVLSQASRAGYLTPIRGSHCSGPLPPPLRHSSFSDLGSWLTNQPLALYGRRDSVKVRASSVPESAGEGSSSPAEAKPDSENVTQTLVLGALFGLWYLFNIYFNIFNKQVLKVYPHPVTITAIQFAVGSTFVLLMWITNLLKRPKISFSQVVAILPLAIVHTMGNLFTNMSLGKVAVSFTHTIKAMEPFFSVLLSALFLGERPSLFVVLSLAPIVGGVALASLTEVSFNWAGFWSAMASNVTFQSRNVLSKKFMVKKEESLDNISLFSIITLLSFVVLAPVALFTEGVKFTPAYLQSAGLNVNEIYVRCLLASLCFHAYQQVSYMILSKVTPVTHSVGNCVKRVVVIVTSVLFFRSPVSPINTLGTSIALTGVFLYSWVKRLKPNKLKSP